MIDFNVPPFVGDELKYIEQAVKARRISGDGTFTKKCNAWLEKNFHAQKVLLTTSGTSALDMAMLLCNFQPGDEVILPSYTFSSTATSILVGGAIPVFVDIRSDTMNIDERKIEAAITPRTRAVAVVHYAGISCEMNSIVDIARRHKLKIIEDAAQGVMSTYNGKFLGTLGDFGCYSFHETKNFSMGEGGAIVINDAAYNERAEILREKGTNRSKFFRGQIDKYTWVDVGDSYLPSEINAAYLYAQLQRADEINENRSATWQKYFDAFQPLANAGKIELPAVPANCRHNGHLFWLKLKDLQQRTEFINFMCDNGVNCVFHYVPLHSAPAGKKYCRFHGEDLFTTRESERLVRLPMYYGLSAEDLNRVVETVKKFFD